jgi:hypothetical protein
MPATLARRAASHACAALAALVLAATACAAQGAATAAASSAISEIPLGWFAGCWELRTPRRIVQELWLPPASGSLIGMSRTLRRTAAGDSLVEFEFLRVTRRDDAWVYHAQPNGRPPTEFTAHATGDTSVTFTNLAHDFPQRITYTRRGADSLVARVEGPMNGATRAIEFPYARATCW